VTITLDARQFSTVTHAGTVSDPWPGTAIQSALMALPATGGTVTVADGVWKIDSLLQLNGVNNFNLVGQSRNAQLMFTGAGQMLFGSAGGGVSNATISTLTINANTLTMASPQSAMLFSNAQNCSFNNNQILGHQNGSIPAVWFEGGSNNQFLNNTITAGPQGGAPLQLQTLGGTPNSGFVVSQNTFDSSALVLLGLNNTKVTNNYFSNRTLGNFIGIDICGPYSGTSQNITIDGNTLDASIGTNGAVISGIPNDPGGTSNIDGFFITNNILKGTVSLIAVQSLDPSNFTNNSLIGSNKTNVTITGNQLSSLWVGSTIDIRGGAGSVDKVLVQSNTLQNSAGVQNVITEDAHTTNATILNQGATVYVPFPWPTLQLSAFGPSAGGWSSNDTYPRELADVNGDTRADIVAFSAAGVYESLATGGGQFAAPTFELAAFGANAGGWSSNDTYPRALADVNGDTRADIVAFSSAGVYESLATGNGDFMAPTFELAAFGTNAGGWSSDDTYPRRLADVNGDTRADIVAFSSAGVYESLAMAGGHFAMPTFELAAFGTMAGGWSSDNTYPRELADVDGDGMADIVGFSSAGVYVSRATGNGHFGAPTFELAAFGAGAGAGGWTSDDLYPRTLADVNADGRADIVGFGSAGVYTSLATGGGHFASPTFQLSTFGLDAGWSSDTTYPRQLADINGNGTADIVGFAANGVMTSPH
jgi:FG-GAP-like repeat